MLVELIRFTRLGFFVVVIMFCFLSLLVFTKVSQSHEYGAWREEKRDDDEFSHFEFSFSFLNTRLEIVLIVIKRSIGSTLQYPKPLSGLDTLSILFKARTTSTALASVLVCMLLFIYST